MIDLYKKTNLTKLERVTSDELTFENIHQDTFRLVEDRWETMRYTLLKLYDLGMGMIGYTKKELYQFFKAEITKMYKAKGLV